MRPNACISVGDDRHRFPVEDDVPGGPDGAAAAVGHGGAGALPLAHPLLHQRLHRRRRRLRHHKLKLISSGEKEREELKCDLHLHMLNYVL